MIPESGWNPCNLSTEFWGTGILSLRMLRYVKSSKRTWPMVMKFICIEQEIWYIHKLCYGGSLEGGRSLYRTHASFLWKGTLLWSLFSVYLPIEHPLWKHFPYFPQKNTWDFSANNCLHGGVCFNSSPSPWSCLNTSSIELRIWVPVGAVRGSKPVMLFGEQFGGISGEMKCLSKTQLFNLLIHQINLFQLCGYSDLAIILPHSVSHWMFPQK